MRFLFDEGLPFRLAAFLVAQGHDVAICGREHPRSLADRVILALAYAEQRTLLTNDKDFGDLVFRDRLPHAGVILFRLGYVPIGARIAYMQQILEEHSDQLNEFIVVTPSSIRVGAMRPGPSNH